LSERPPGRLVGTLQLFADIARFRKGPEDLPVSGALLGYCILGCIAIPALLVSLLRIPLQGSTFGVLSIDALVTVLFIALVLNMAKRPERFVQTATAMFGFQLVVVPVAVAVAWLILMFSTDPVWKMPVFMLKIALEIWALAVMARILSSATGWSLFMCLVLTVMADLVSMFAIVGVFPQTAAPAVPA
jgi:hypothetical protein